MKIHVIFLSFLFYSALTWAEVNKTVLPLEFNTGNPAPFGMTSTFINAEQTKVPVVLDTGAHGPVGLYLTAAALRHFKVTPSNEIVCGVTFAGDYCRKAFIVSSVTIGDFTLNNVKGVLIDKLWGNVDPRFIDTDASQNGVIGYSLLAQFNVLLDYPQKQMVLYKKGIYPEDLNKQHWVVFPFQEPLHTIHYLNGQRLRMVWDTGAVPSVLNAKIAAFFKTSACPSTYQRFWPTCKQVQTSSFTDIYGNTLPNTWFIIKPFPAAITLDGLIGSNFFHEHPVFFDFGKHEIYVRV